MASSEKRCLYEILGLSRDCAADEIRSAYKRLALQRHPDKLIRSGVSEAEATAAFQELVNAYEVLSDARERAWYDSHRNQILFSNSSASNGSASQAPELFSFFSNSVYSGYSDKGKGFYKVYGDLFEKIYANELNFAKKVGGELPKEAPVMGNLESPYAQVTAFYSYWFGFVTVMDFFWADQYDVMSGPNRKSRRLMEEENKKLRKKARREYNDTVSGLAKFVKKRDKRVIDMQVKRNEEMEKKKEEEKQRKKELERQKAEKARNYEEPEWAKIEEYETEEDEELVEEKKKELYCVACGKKFKTDKQWKNHEQSKKHKEKVAELREAFSEEDREFEEAEVGESNVEDRDDGVNELEEQFEANFGIQEEESNDEINNGSGSKGQLDTESGSDDDDEASFLQTLIKNKNKSKNQTNKAQTKKTEVEVESDELEFMDYNDTKLSRRNRGGRRRGGRRPEQEQESKPKQEPEPEPEPEPNAEAELKPEAEAETSTADVTDRNGHSEEYEGRNGHSHVEEESITHPLPESGTKSKGDGGPEKSNKHSQKAANKKSTTKKENAPKSKVASRGKKQKVPAEANNNACEKCGEEFDTRNKLHKHLGDTGHATLKSR